MAKISKQDIDYIFDNIDIVSLVSEYVKLEKRGQNYLGLCPFHNEKTPSFTVSPEKTMGYFFLRRNSKRWCLLFLRRKK